MPSSLRLPAAFAGSLLAAEAAVLLLRPRERFARQQVEPRAYFSQQELVKATRFRRGQLRIFAAQSALELGLLALAARRAPSAARRPLLTGAASAAGLTLATTAAGLPLRALARRRARDVGLVTQSWRGWAGDVAKGGAIGTGMAAVGGAALAYGTRRYGERWWLPGGALAAGAAVLFTFVGPVVLDPIFNRFTPLPAGPVRDDVLELARRAGVRVREVYEVDASRRTTAANAYVNGLGRTKRVVLFDTLLRDFTAAETRLVIAHELGHVRHRDVPRGLVFATLAAPLSTLAVARLGRLAQREGTTPVPAVALALAVTTPALSAIGNQLSRAIERRADDFALRLTGEPDAMVAFERRIAVKNVADPAPPRWQRLVLGTHPPTVERIGQALAYASERR